MAINKDTKHSRISDKMADLTPASLDNSMNLETLAGIKLVFNFLKVPFRCWVVLIPLLLTVVELCEGFSKL